MENYDFIPEIIIHLCDTFIWSSTKCQHEVLLEPGIDILCNLVTLRADIHSLAAILGL